MPGLNRVARGESRPANDILHVLGDDFFIAHAVLYRTDGAVFVEHARCLCHGRTRVNALGGDDAVITAGNFARITSGVHPGGEIRRPRKPEPALANRFHVRLPHVIRPYLMLAGARQVRGKQAAHRAATYDADFHSVPSSRFSVLSSQFSEVARTYLINRFERARLRPRRPESRKCWALAPEVNRCLLTCFISF